MNVKEVDVKEIIVYCKKAQPTLAFAVAAIASTLYFFIKAV